MVVDTCHCSGRGVGGVCACVHTLANGSVESIGDFWQNETITTLSFVSF